jgi:hypothetical protein
LGQAINSTSGQLPVVLTASTSEAINASINANGGNVNLTTGAGNDLTLNASVTTGAGGQIVINSGGSILDDSINSTQLSADVIA